MINYVPRLQALYEKDIRGAMNDEYKYKNSMMIPRLDKIVLNVFLLNEPLTISNNLSSLYQGVCINK